MFLFQFFPLHSEAIETRHALHGIRWPTSNPKCLNVDFGTENLMEKAMASTADDVKLSVPPSRDDRIASSNSLHESTRERVSSIIFDVFSHIRNSNGELFAWHLKYRHR